MTDHTSSNAYAGSMKVTCKVAAQLLNDGLANKAWFRPDGFMNHDDPDNDVAFVWLDEGAEYEMLQTNSSESEGA